MHLLIFILYYVYIKFYAYHLGTRVRGVWTQVDLELDYLSIKSQKEEPLPNLLGLLIQITGRGIRKESAGLRIPYCPKFEGYSLSDNLYGRI